MLKIQQQLITTAPDSTDSLKIQEQIQHKRSYSDFEILLKILFQQNLNGSSLELNIFLFVKATNIAVEQIRRTMIKKKTKGPVFV